MVKEIWGGAPGKPATGLPRAWDNADKNSCIISERVPDDAIVEISEPYAYLQRGVGNNVTIRAKSSIAILGDVGHGVTIIAGDYVRISADAGHNLAVRTKGASFRKVGNDAVVSVEEGVNAISFGAGSVVEAKTYLIIRDVCGHGCRFISPHRRGQGMTSPECRQQDHRPGEFWRSTFGLR